MNPNYEVAVYYFPQYHADPRNDKWHGPGWTEWDLVRRAEPRFDGHSQPKVPLWGYEDESLPEVMEKKIGIAADHGISTFIYDWYWYANKPFLNRCLDEGFLSAQNNSRLKFALMWANHDWLDIHPIKRSTPAHTLATGTVSKQEFETATDHIIEKYFNHPSYWKIDGRPYFSLYELMRLVEGLGGVDRTREALDGFRRRAQRAGLPDLHLNAVVWGVQILPGETSLKDPNEMLAKLGFDSVTSYVWIHHISMVEFPMTGYARYAKQATQDWSRFTQEFELPYYPNVTMGWDPSPRTLPSDFYENLGYPFTPILDGNTPDAFGESLEQAKAFLDSRPPEQRILTVNAWNEWTEGSYLEPDTVHGMGYLEAIRKVFGKRN